MSLWRAMSRVLRIGRARYYVGRDLANNEYYELPSLHGKENPRTRRRWLGDYDPETIPIQWDAWLRHTRKQVPTIEELERDAERIRIVRYNGMVLEMRAAAERQRMLEQQAAEHADATATATQEASRAKVQRQDEAPQTPPAKNGGERQRASLKLDPLEY